MHAVPRLRYRVCNAHDNRNATALRCHKTVLSVFGVKYRRLCVVCGSVLDRHKTADVLTSAPTIFRRIKVSAADVLY